MNFLALFVKGARLVPEIRQASLQVQKGVLQSLDEKIVLADRILDLLKKLLGLIEIGGLLPEGFPGCLKRARGFPDAAGIGADAKFKPLDLAPQIALTLEDLLTSGLGAGGLLAQV